MFRTEPQANKSQGVDFAVSRQVLGSLEALESIDRVISPFAVYLAGKVASLVERFLNFLIALRVGVQLITRRRSRPRPASACRSTAMNCGSRNRLGFG